MLNVPLWQDDQVGSYYADVNHRLVSVDFRSIAENILRHTYSNVRGFYNM